MQLKKPLHTKALWLSKEAIQKKQAGLDYTYDECEVKSVIFYDISYIAEDNTDEKEYTEVGTHSGEIFVVPIHPNEFYKIVEEHR